jgi:hypothetical protein
MIIMTKNLTSFPDVPLALKYLELSCYLPQIDHHSVQAAAWRTGPVKQVAKEIWEQMQDNAGLVYDIVGRKVYEAVEKIFTQHKA